MADFCKQCSIKIHGRDHGDLKGLCKPGEIIEGLCEGCGDWVMVDHTGARVAEAGEPDR